MEDDTSVSITDSLNKETLSKTEEGKGHEDDSDTEDLSAVDFSEDTPTSVTDTTTTVVAAVGQDTPKGKDDKDDEETQMDVEKADDTLEEVTPRNSDDEDLYEKGNIPLQEKEDSDKKKDEKDRPSSATSDEGVSKTEKEDENERKDSPVGGEKEETDGQKRKESPLNQSKETEEEETIPKKTSEVTEKLDENISEKMNEEENDNENKKNENSEDLVPSTNDDDNKVTGNGGSSSDYKKDTSQSSDTIENEEDPSKIKEDGIETNETSDTAGTIKGTDMEGSAPSLGEKDEGSDSPNIVKKAGFDGVMTKEVDKPKRDDNKGEDQKTEDTPEKDEGGDSTSIVKKAGFDGVMTKEIDKPKRDDDQKTEDTP